MRRFRMTPAGKGPNDPWFHLGSLEVGTAMLVVLVEIVAFVFWAFQPSDKLLTNAMVLEVDKVLHGQVWRLVTWPFAYPGGLGLFDVLTIFFFWYFGHDIETNLLGRVRMAKMLVLMTLVLALLWVGLVLVADLGSFYWLSGLAALELMVLLAWIAEWPQRRFLFNIPAWLFGVVIVGITVLNYVGYQQWWHLLHFALGVAGCALVARAYGMLSEHHWIPKLRSPAGRRGRAPRRPHKSFASDRPTVVDGPWERPVSRDEARMNALLDKIHAGGIESLSQAEVDELHALRERLRRR